MEISYRSKSNEYGIGIQINYQPEEVDTLSLLINELEANNFKKRLSGIPDRVKQKSRKVFFYRTGSRPFGIFTGDEVVFFVNESEKILKRYDKNFNLKTLLPYDND